MYAIVDIAGQQFKVEKQQKIFVNRLDIDEGKKIEFDKVLLIDNDGKVNIGSPVISGASISAQVLSHVRGDKVLVFKKKRRKGYQKLNGHRQDLSELLIEEINEKSTGKKASAEDKKEVKAEKKEAPAKETKAKEETKTEEKKADKQEPKAETKKAEGTTAKKEEKAVPKAQEAKAEEKKSSESSKATDAKDDLTKIKGIGAVYQKQLHELGFTTYESIASLNAEGVTKISENIDGVTDETIKSDEWVKQAKELKEKKK